MNHTDRIKELLERYFEGTSTDADESQLREYFSSEHVDEELKVYRSIFAYLKREKGQPSEPEKNTLERVAIIEAEIPLRPVKWWHIASVAAACLLAFIFFPREHQPALQTLCTGTYVMVDGVCYDDFSLIRKHATETIDQIIQPVGNDAAIDALNFLDDN